MYVQIIDDGTNSYDSDDKAERIKEAVHSVDPEIPCEVVFRDGRDEKVIRVQCFGEFEAFGADKKPLNFKRARTKELFAVLVCNRGSMLSMGTIMSILWEDGEDSDSDRSYLRTMISDLKKTLSAVGADDVVIKKYNSIGINPGKIECDYYDFLEGKPEAVEKYNGQFMRQYAWSEYELSQI